MMYPVNDDIRAAALAERMRIHHGETCGNREEYVRHLERCLSALAMEASGGLLSKTTYPVETYLNAAKEHYEERVGALESKIEEARISSIYLSGNFWCCPVCEGVVEASTGHATLSYWHSAQCPLREDR